MGISWEGIGVCRGKYGVDGEHREFAVGLSQFASKDVVISGSKWYAEAGTYLISVKYIKARRGKMEDWGK